MTELHPYEQTRENLEEVVAEIEQLASEIEAGKAAIEAAYGPETAALAAEKEQLGEREADLRKRIAAAWAFFVPRELKLKALRGQEKELRERLKPMAVENVQGWQAPASKIKYAPKTATVAGVRMVKVRQARILDEERAADLLAEIIYTPPGSTPRPLVTAEIVYHFDRNAIRTYLLEDERRRTVPGVLELTAVDEPESWRMGLVRKEGPEAPQEAQETPEGEGADDAG